MYIRIFYSMSLSASSYTRGHLGSIPKITVETIDKNIAHVMEFINNNPRITQEQLENLDRNIKFLHNKKETAYLVEPKSPNRLRNTPSKSMRKSVRFSPGTKTSRGGKTKRKRRKLTCRRVFEKTMDFYA